MEEVGHGVDGWFHHGNQATDQDVTGQQVGHGEGHGKVGDGEGNRFQNRLITFRAVLVDKQFQRTHDQLRIYQVYDSI